MSKLNGFGVGLVVSFMIAACGVLAGDLTPPGPPGATMRTLQEIYDKIEAIGGYVGYEGGDAAAGEILSGKKAWVGGAEVTGTMPNVGQQNVTPGTTAQTITRGYHDGTGEVAGDANLAAGNIKKDVTIFGVTGTHEGEGGGGGTYNAGVPRTGQTTSYRTGDDGDLQRGVAWPDPRFTDNEDGTVTDNLTGLMWVKEPHSLDGNSGAMTWDDAIDFCNNLTFAGHADLWLPNVRELQSLIDYGRYYLTLPSGHPFTGVQMANYWSSSTVEDYWNHAWFVNLYDGVVSDYGKGVTTRLWPVRAGQ